MSIGDIFAGGRYKVLHELGHGGSTLIHRLPYARESNVHGFVTLKVLSAEESSKSLTGSTVPGRKHLAITDHFF